MPQVLCPSIVGRDDELSLLIDALGSSGRMVVVSGEAGIGKSRLARELADRARTDGVRTLQGRAVNVGTPVPFRPLAEAVRSGIRDGLLDATGLDDVLLSAVVGDDAGRTLPGPASSLAVADALLRLSGDAAAATGLLLVLEDLHWADADTLAVLDHLADHLAASRVLCVATVRSDSGGPAAELVAQLVARRSAAARRCARVRCSAAPSSGRLSPPSAPSTTKPRSRHCAPPDAPSSSPRGPTTSRSRSSSGTRSRERRSSPTCSRRSAPTSPDVPHAP